MRVQLKVASCRFRAGDKVGPCAGCGFGELHRWPSVAGSAVCVCVCVSTPSNHRIGCPKNALYAKNIPSHVAHPLHAEIGRLVPTRSWTTFGGAVLPGAGDGKCLIRTPTLQSLTDFE